MKKYPPVTPRWHTLDCIGENHPYTRIERRAIVEIHPALSPIDPPFEYILPSISDDGIPTL